MFPDLLMKTGLNSNSNSSLTDQKHKTALQHQFTTEIRLSSRPSVEGDFEYSDPDIEEEEEESDDDIEMMFELDRNNLNKIERVAKYADKIFEIDQNDTTLDHISADKINSFYTTSIEELRKNVVTWIIYIAQDYSMLSNTWYQAVEYFDSLLSSVKIPRKEMHIAGLTCLWMSAKMEERSIPKLSDIAAFFDASMPTECFVNYEKKILQAIDFQLSMPTPKLYLRRYLDVIDAEESVLRVANFFCELSVFELSFHSYHPDILALSSVVLGKICIGEYCPIDRLLTYSHGRPINLVKECCKQLLLVAQGVSENPKNIILQRYFDDTEEGSIKNIDLSLSLVDDIKSFL